MLYVSRFRPTPERMPEWLATLWQGPLPDGMQLRSWLYIDGGTDGMLMVWECESDEGRAWVERVFSPFGELTTQTAIDATGGMAPCFARDDEAFGRWMQQRGTDETEVERQVALRRAGKDAPDMASAMAAGRAWASGG